LGLLLHRAEHSVGQACAQALLDGYPDAPVPAEEVPDRHPADVAPSEPIAWDAWDAAHQDAAADAELQRLLVLADEDVEKSAGPAQDARVRDAWFQQVRSLARAEELDAAAEPYKQDEVQSGERSCAEQEVAAVQQQLEARPDVEQLVPEALTKL
jgi:hypothetical protein